MCAAVLRASGSKSTPLSFRVENTSNAPEGPAPRRGKKSSFRIRTILNKGGSVSYLVYGMLKGVQIRRQFKTRPEAINYLNQLELEDAKSPLHEPRLTWLNNEQIAEAEASVTMINKKFPDQGFGLLKATNFFLDKFWLPVSEHTLNTAKKLYIEAKKQEGVSPSQMSSIETLLNRVSLAFPKEKLHELDWKKLEDWLVKVAGDKAPKTWNNMRGNLGAFFAWCLVPKRHWIPENPILHIDKKDDPHKTPKIVTVDVASAIMADAEEIDNGCFALAVAFMLFLGIRPEGEMTRIQEEVARGAGVSQDFMIDDKQVFLSAAITKTGKPRWIDLPANFKGWLEAYPLTAKNLDMSAFFAARAMLRKKHNIPHDGLRHSFCSYYAKQMGPGAAATAAGHSEAIQTARYLNGSMSVDEAKAFFAIKPKRKTRN